jgi:hypothetical protein
MGRVVPDSANPGIYRALKSGDFSDISNLSWAKDAVLAQAIREVAYELANDPSNGGLKKQFRHPCVFLRRLSDGPNETPLKPSNPNTCTRPLPAATARQSAATAVGGGLLGVGHVRYRMDFASQNDGLLPGPIRRDRGDSKRLCHPHPVRPHARVS